MTKYWQLCETLTHCDLSSGVVIVLTCAWCVFTSIYICVCHFFGNKHCRSWNLLSILSLRVSDFCRTKNQWLRVSQVFIYPSLLCCISISALISGRWRRVLFVLGFVTNSMEQLWLYECSFGPSFPIESFVKFMLKTLSFEVSFINYLHICLILSLSLSLAAGV